MGKPVAKLRVRDNDRGWRRVLREVLRPGQHVTVGVHGTEDARDGEIGNVELMAVHEFGSETAGIPERSVIRHTVDENLNAYRRLSSALGRQIYNGRMTVHAALEALGSKVASDMRRTIDRTPGQWPALEDSTIASRQFGGTKPLLDRGELQKSIKHKVTL
jgi:hypothetical protein